MARIPEKIIEEVKNKNDIVELVSSYVSLESKSRQNLFGLCPFHDEKTPSFSVSPSKQMFYCFGCNKGGDAISFIMAIEHMSYPEAVRFLADRVGIDIPDDHGDDARYQEQKDKRERLYALNKEAARYFYKALYSPLGRDALVYMQERRISKQTAASFGLGFAPNQWQGLLNHLRNKGFTEEEIEESGLFKKNKNGNWYDLFRNRLIFPIIDVIGNIVAFGARVLDDSMPKYLNSPETLIYTKGKHLYGLNIAKRTKAERLIVVEGYMDCITLHQAGFDEVVASLGTALTSDQAKLLRKYREEIILSYDMDRAGRMASIRNIDVLEEKNVESYVLILDGAKDPDDFLRTNTPADFRYQLNHVMKGLDYKFLHIREEATYNANLDKHKYQDLAASLLLSINNPVLRQLHVPEVARTLEVPEDSVHLLLRMREEEQKHASKSYSPLKSEPLKNDTLQSNLSSESPSNKESRVHLTYTEASVLARIVKRNDLYRERNLELHASWFKEKQVRSFVGKVLTLAEENRLNEDIFLQLLNQEDEDIREILLPIMSRFLYEEDTSRNDEENYLLMQTQALLIKQDYFARLSKYYTYLLDHPQEGQDNSEIRKKFLWVSQERKTIMQVLQSLENSIHKSEE